MSKIHNRLTKLENILTPNPPPVFYVYFYDTEKGYSEHWNGSYFATFSELATAQGWMINGNDLKLCVRRASQTKTGE